MFRAVYLNSEVSGLFGRVRTIWFDLGCVTKKMHQHCSLRGRIPKCALFWVIGGGCWHLIVLEKPQRKANCSLDSFSAVSSCTLIWYEQCLGNVAQAEFVGSVLIHSTSAILSNSSFWAHAPLFQYRQLWHLFYTFIRCVFTKDEFILLISKNTTEVRPLISWMNHKFLQE